MAEVNFIYEVTLVLDRYHGTYSNGKWVAWNASVGAVHRHCDGQFEGDAECCDFWCSVRKDPKMIPMAHGLGSTPDAAIAHLAETLFGEEGYAI